MAMNIVEKIDDLVRVRHMLVSVSDKRGLEKLWLCPSHQQNQALEIASMVEVARRYDVNANQVFAWRKRYGAEAAEPSALRLMPVTVTADASIGAEPTVADEAIEIAMSGGYRLRVGSGFEEATLRRVLDVLERR